MPPCRVAPVRPDRVRFGMISMAACVLAILASTLAIIALARCDPSRRRLWACLAVVPGLALIPVGWAQVTIWVGATLVLGWLAAEAVHRMSAGEDGS
jgi:hypothetical protein